MTFKLDELEHDSQEKEPMDVSLPDLDINTDILLEDCEDCSGSGELDGRECCNCNGKGVKELVAGLSNEKPWCREDNPFIWSGDEDGDENENTAYFLDVEGM